MNFIRKCCFSSDMAYTPDGALRFNLTKRGDKKEKENDRNTMAQGTGNQ